MIRRIGSVLVNYIYLLLTLAALSMIILGWSLDRQFGDEAILDSLMVVFIFLVIVLAGVILYLKERKSKQLLNRIESTTEDLSNMVQKEKLMNRYLSMISHDIRNPLQVIGSCAEMLEEPESGIHENYRKFLSAIDQGQERIRRLVDDMLHIQEIQEQGITVELQETPVHFILDHLIEDYLKVAERKGVFLDYADMVRNRRFRIDKKIFLQVADNLISNAVKYSPRGTTVRVRLEADDEDHLLLKVQDKGAGIEPQEMSKLFSRFERLSSRPTAGESSTGLGLAIAKEQMDVIGGKIWCESEPGHGALFVAEFTQHRGSA